MSPAARARLITSPGSSRSPPGSGVLAVMTASTPPGRSTRWHAPYSTTGPGRLTGAGASPRRGGLAGPGDGQGSLPGLRAAGLQQQVRPAGADFGELAQLRVQAAQARQDPLVRERAGGQAQGTPPGRRSGGEQHAVPSAGED